jgi:hypothetical protein
VDDSGERRRLPIGVAAGWHTIVLSRVDADRDPRRKRSWSRSGPGFTPRKTLANTTR